MVVIVVSGPPGSGKTTQAKKIAKYFGLRYHSAGMIFRKMAEERGISIEELSRIATEDPSIDIEIDRRTYLEALKGDIVIDGHLTAWIIADIADVRVLITAPLATRIKRIALRDGKSFMEAYHETVMREYLQKIRFRKYYGIDIDDLSIFDIIVNTENLRIDDTFEIVKTAIEKILKRKRKD